MIEIMCACAEVGFLPNHRTAGQFNFPQGIEIGPIAHARGVAEGHMPGHLNPRSLMDKGTSFNLATEDSKPQQPPRIKVLWSPLTK
jgi:hypothetical protein